ncbi:MAG: aldehyde dehydrogenase family protein [Gammaproteobacteria bacterium]|nr:aldehyde dehydrogenase family protein [Gammaproteobacteria bacterium]
MAEIKRYPIMSTGDRPAAGEIDVTAPFDGKLIARCATVDEPHIEAAMTAAQALYRDRAGWLSIPQRLAILEKTAEIMSAEAESLARQAAQEGGKPLIDSRVEVTRAIDGVKLCIEHLRTEQGEFIPMAGTASSTDRIAFTRREPIGVVVAVSAFNHPLNLIVHQVAPAVATGCPVVVKPAGDTPISCLRFVEILREAGLPADWCQCVITANTQVSQKLVTDPRVAFFSFIGSARVGWYLRSQLAPGARCALEHGGVAPMFVLDDADMDAAVAAALKGGFYHAGQVCVSVQRVFVPRDIARDFAERLAAGARELRIGDPTSPETEIGPLIRPAEVERVHEWVTEAVAAGATRLSGGDPLSDSTYPCTVLLDPPADARVSIEEVFGPVVCVYGYDDLDAALETANSLPVAFQGAVFTRDLDRAMEIYTRLDASAVMVNDHTAFRVDAMPFAGLRHSGLGVGGIPYTMHDMSIEKMLVLRSGHIQPG